MPVCCRHQAHRVHNRGTRPSLLMSLADEDQSRTPRTTGNDGKDILGFRCCRQLCCPRRKPGSSQAPRLTPRAFSPAKPPLTFCFCLSQTYSRRGGGCEAQPPEARASLPQPRPLLASRDPLAPGGPAVTGSSPSSHEMSQRTAASCFSAQLSPPAAKAQSRCPTLHKEHRGLSSWGGSARITLQ